MTPKVFTAVSVFLTLLFSIPVGAQTDDLLGCTDELALNYNPSATQDDGSCLGNGCPDPEALNFDPFTMLFGLEGNLEVCLYNEDWVLGCTDELADNYDPLANSDDGSCTYSDFPGCTNPDAWNFNPSATEDDGTCLTPGCPDPNALNYDAFSAFFGGTGSWEQCEYAEDAAGCTDPLAPNFDPLATEDDGSCADVEVSGCTDTNALNYNPWATEDNGSCFGLGSGAACGDPLALNFNPFFFLVDPVEPSNSDCEYGDVALPETIPGCTDPGAANFNSMATWDNGSCVYATLGCTNPMALNYALEATMDDGSCMFPEDVMEVTEWNGLAAEIVGEDADTGMVTFRLYAVFNDPEIEVVTVFGDADHPLEIAPLDGEFFQASDGVDFADELPAEVDGALAMDTWLTIGLGDDLTFVGGDLFPFSTEGQTLSLNTAIGGAWFRIPGMGNAGHPDTEGRVLLGQFTHAGSAQAELNLQYFDAEGMPRQVHGATVFWPAGSADESANGSDLDNTPAGCSGDLDSDGLVSVNDLLELISQFGNSCP